MAFVAFITPMGFMDGMRLAPQRPGVEKTVLARPHPLELDALKVAGPSATFSRAFYLTTPTVTFSQATASNPGSHASLTEGNLVLRSLDGAFIRRVIDRSESCVPEHAHDWPVLSLFVIGSYLNETEIGETFISGPSAVFYRAGARHRNTTAASGFEQIEIEFDPSWLGQQLLPRQPVTRWVGGRVAREARSLAHACQTDAGEDRLRAALQQFLAGASPAPAQETVSWIDTITQRLRENTTLRVNELATAVRRHPAWIGSAYRRATGEGLLETAARLRVERATFLLRETAQPLSAIALEAGFCDQSHMNRTFRRVLGRSPATIREERRDFRQTTSRRPTFRQPTPALATD